MDEWKLPVHCERGKERAKRYIDIQRQVCALLFFIGASEALITPDINVVCSALFVLSTLFALCNRIYVTHTSTHTHSCFTHIFLSTSWYINHWSTYSIVICCVLFVSFEINQVIFCCFVRVTRGFSNERNKKEFNRKIYVFLVSGMEFFNRL